MVAVNYWIQLVKSRIVALFALAIAICFTVIACGGSPAQEQAQGSVSPEVVTDYIHTVLESDRTAYTKNVVNRLKKLEGKDKKDGVVPAEATESWQTENGVPLPAQMFRLGAELASEKGQFTYGLISPWNINDAQAPKSDFEKTAMEKVVEMGEPYKEYQEIGGQKYFSALYPDKAVAEACVSCHNNHPVHQERYPDKVFEMGDVMGGVMINLPVEGS
ncbi:MULTISPECIES: Tll0287-like domain-containing protein [unclassified Coleofasciculus]|uniref:Tll0287-like domain-containing protein n=1 Tax=unclassified Coleofasciculus TaxID=2692782 RepID=UPI001882AA46|nr:MULTISPECIES: DUF3365 domain-containing protein [unclassified Coleofasciculus]MBE9128653.1 DUF3365 domain-containing protein [Coleofasciculus sp. LEGE 07081]MBE9149752.1 DUF3365 domain-containing protein [Coleofasciculus sp. LEGE 07092]